MANDERCIRCGMNETAHEDWEHVGKCCEEGFTSSVEHHEDCCGAVAGADIMCDGDCEATIALMESESERWKHHVNGATVYMYLLQLRKGAHPSQLTTPSPD